MRFRKEEDMKRILLASFGVIIFTIVLTGSALAGCGCGGCNGNCAQGGCGANCAQHKEAKMCPAHDLVMAKAGAAKAGEPTAVNVGNKICPVMGEKIDEKFKVTYEYEGKIYNFCCPGCIGEFKKDPQKYIHIIEQQS
jgi:YHS domain-containing protein